MQSASIRWHDFTAAPHRMFFFAGGIQTVLALLWWLIDLAGRYAGLLPTIDWTIPSPLAHGFLMIYGLFAFFIFGFLMTTYPRWMNGEQILKEDYIGCWSLMSLGACLIYPGLYFSARLLTLALIIFLAGWVWGLYALSRVYIKARHPDKRHATITTLMLLAGAFFISIFITQDPLAVRMSLIGGIWLFLLPLFFSVSHRMIPFFSANVIPGYELVRPYWALGLVTLLGVVHAVMIMLYYDAWTWLVDIPMALTGFYLTVRWQLLKSLSVKLLAMLHISFAWFGIAMALYATQSMTFLLTDQYLFGLAPLHALVIGYFSSMLLAMITRVTMGHSGRPLVASPVVWGIFLLFQLVTLLRVIADFPGMVYPVSSDLYLSAATLWLVCFLVWNYRHLGIYWRARTDNKPG